MATLDRKLPSPDTFLFKPWSSYTDVAKLYYADNVRVEDNGKEILNSREAMKLNKDDMHVFGQCPAHDDFYLVVCNVCNQVVKPQGFQTHCAEVEEFRNNELRGQKGLPHFGKIPPSAAYCATMFRRKGIKDCQPRPSSDRRHGSPCDPRAPLVQRKPRGPLAHGDTGTGTGTLPRPFRPPRDNHHHPSGKAPHAVYPPKGSRGKPCMSVPVVSLEKMPSLGRADGALSRTNSAATSSSPLPAAAAAAPAKPPLTPAASHKSQERIPNGQGPGTPASHCDRRPAASPSPVDRRATPTPSPSSTERRPTASPSSLDRRPSASPSLLDRKHQNGTKANKPYRRLSERVFDPNKHCGVLDPESRRPCCRSLTCKTHPLTHRRAVPGRGKLFDSLLAEHKGQAMAMEKEKDGGGREGHQNRPALSHDSSSSATPTNCPDGRNTSPLKTRLANLHIPRPSGSGGSICISLSTGLSSDPAPPCGGAEDGGRLSSEDGEAEFPEDSERADCQYSPCHPRPAACCTFNSRLMGRGCYVFDRRWSRIRLALHLMVEKHVTAQMWKKIPLATESPALSRQAVNINSTYGVTPPLLSSASVPRSARGAFSTSDPDSLLAPTPALAPTPPQGKRPRTKPARPLRVCQPLPGALGRTAGERKKRPGPSSVPAWQPPAPPPYTASPGRTYASGIPSLNSHPNSPALSANGAVAPCVKPEGPGRDPGTASRSLTEDRASPTHSPLSISVPEGRKRKSSCSYGRSSNVTKMADLTSVYRRSVVTESPRATLPWQPKVHH